jgi:hypothetical protein
MKKRRAFSILAGLVLLVAGPLGLAILLHGFNQADPPVKQVPLAYQPRIPFAETSTFGVVVTSSIPSGDANAPLPESAERQPPSGYQFVELIDRNLKQNNLLAEERIRYLLAKAVALTAEGEARGAYRALEQARACAEENKGLARKYLFTIIYLQGLAGLRIGENENCIFCRGESSCIFPIAPAAIHRTPEGSRLAIQHFGEYLRQSPEDLEIRWLLNLAHATLGEYPEKVEPPFRLSLDRFLHSEFDIGKFRDVAHLVLVNRFNQAGSAILEDFDNDGRLDLVVTSIDADEGIAFYRNRGDGTFEECAARAGLSRQPGGLYCVQGDYNNDGWMDIFVCRGAWKTQPVRPSLLRNNGDGTFTDVTDQAGLGQPLNSNSAAWADYDNDGFVDLFVCCETQPNRLYRNKGDGTFEEVSARAGLAGGGLRLCKGAAWIDYDNDDYPDLFLSNLGGEAQLFHNNRDGTFQDVTQALGISGPSQGFSCWAWDFDNDGWLDIFATSYAVSLEDVVKGLQGQPHHQKDRNKLYRNQGGKKFQDCTREAGLDQVFACIGSNFGDFDNDGYLDFYLGTGGSSFATLVPNRMFKNVAGQRFADVTVSSGTGHLQKGHGVACGDWDRDGDVDIFVQIGGAVSGDRFHNVLFQNPGQGNHWLTVKLVGQKTNRAAVGARLRAITAGDQPLTVCRHVSSGSSFGANPYQQTLGLAQAKRVARLEIHWPTSGTTQVFRDIAVDQAIEITEFATEYRRLNWTAIPLPK